MIEEIDMTSKNGEEEQKLMEMYEERNMKMT